MALKIQHLTGINTTDATTITTAVQGSGYSDDGMAKVLAAVDTKLSAAMDVEAAGRSNSPSGSC